MKIFYFVPTLFSVLSLAGCGSVPENSAPGHSIGDVRQNGAPENGMPKAVVDSSKRKLPETVLASRYFYRYLFASTDDWQRTPDWLFGNLAHFGIAVNEAWYLPPGSHADSTNGIIRSIADPPSFIIGLSTDNPDILEHHFDRLENFDPATIKSIPGRKMLHFVSGKPSDE